MADSDRYEIAIARTALARRQRVKRRLQLVVVLVLAYATLVVRDGKPEPIRIVETGFSRVSNLDDGKGISWAVVVENTGDRVAYGVTLHLTYRLSDGDLDDGAYSPSIDALLPGERVGLAGSSLQSTTDGATGFEVEVYEVERWGPPESEPRIVPEGIEVGYSPENHPYVDLTAVAHGDEALSDLEANVLFRAEDGSLIGGASAWLREPLEPDEPAPVRVSTNSPFPDLATVEVYVTPVPQDS